MKLYVMRHGEAIPTGGEIQEDAQRPLSAAGQKQVRAVAEGLKRQGARPNRIVSSPLVRTRETAAILAEIFDSAKVESSAALAPNASPAGLKPLLGAHKGADEMLWIAHHPDVTLWISFLTMLDSSVCPLFGTASVAALDFQDSKKAKFLWFQTSEQLALP